jgi:pyridinium-3,5-biscarboxylic acid mononucleotide sulfurtransferase
MLAAMCSCQAKTNELSPDLIAKRDRLIELLRGYGSCAVAYSGGLDSTVLAKAAHLALGDCAVAVTGTSASMAGGELDEARETARWIGIRHELIATGELDVAAYRDNKADRCYHCKSELFARVEEVARRLSAAVVVDGSNHDDREDYRPGRKAVAERNVKSPLAECGLTKSEIRELAKSWKLPTWNKPATPCLSSRIAYGEQVTPERLAMVDRAEQFLRERGFQPMRVRYHKGDVARIEVAIEQLSRFADEGFRREVVEHLKSLGFKYVSLDLEGFRSGSMNAVLKLGKGGD